MLNDAVAAFLDTVSERGFDQAFLAILRDQGFENPRLTHGSSEFGKDFVARRDGQQWAFQSKAGSIGLPAWRGITGQLDELRLSNYAGPEFDPGLPRKAILVTTGSLVGNAPLAASEYNQRAVGKNEIGLEIWQRDDLVGLLSGNRDAVLSGSIDGGIHSILGAIERRTATIEEVNDFAQRWVTFPTARLVGMGVVELSLVGERLKQAGRLDLACHLALGFVRASWAGERTQAEAIEAADVGGLVFDSFAADLWSRCDDSLFTRDVLRQSEAPDGSFANWVSYPVRCTRLTEILGLWALRLRKTDPAQAATVAGWLADFSASQPGAAHHISDRYAVSLIPPALAMSPAHPESVKNLLIKATVWLCDHYEYPRYGLAPITATPDQEIEFAFGDVYEHVNIEKRRSSQLAGVLLDLAAMLMDTQTYLDIRNDQLAVRLCPVVLRCKSGGAQFSLESLDNRWDVNPDYPDEPIDEILEINHHLNDIGSRDLVAIGREWDLLATSSVLRDRHFPLAISAFK